MIKGSILYNKGKYENAINVLETSLTIEENISKYFEIEVKAYHYLANKHLGKDYDQKEIYSLIKDIEDIRPKLSNVRSGLNLRLYELLEDKQYLETGYNQIQEKASAMEEELAAKFLSYPIPKAIVEEWEKVK